MDGSKIQEWLDDNLPTLLDAFGVGHWEVRTEFKGLRGHAAEIFIQFEYETADISIDPLVVVDEKMLQEELTHEIAHIVAAPIDMAQDAVKRLDLDKSTHLVLNEVFSKVHEMVAKNIERMHYAHVELLGESDEQEE